MPSKTFYDTTTGRGLGTSLSGAASPRKPDVGEVFGIHDCACWYFPAGVPTERLAINYTLDKSTIVADGAEVATVTGLPASCTIHHNGNEYTAEPDGSFTFDAVTPGRFVFVIREIAYLETTIVIEAT